MCDEVKTCSKNSREVASSTCATNDANKRRDSSSNNAVMSIRIVIIDVARIVDVVSVTRILAVIRPVMVKADSKSYKHSSFGLMKCTASIYIVFALHFVSGPLVC
jgi:hypothetical protein